MPEQKMPNKAEYEYFRQLAGVLSFLSNRSIVEKRAKTVPGTWRDLCLIHSLTFKSLQALLSTVPKERLKHFNKELANTMAYTQVRYDVTGKDITNDFAYVPTDAMEDLVRRVVGYECTLCELEGKDCKKCKLKKTLDQLYLYNINPTNKDCPWRL